MTLQDDFKAKQDNLIVLARYGALRDLIAEHMGVVIQDVLSHKDVGQPDDQATRLADFIAQAMLRYGRGDITVTPLANGR